MNTVICPVCKVTVRSESIDLAQQVVNCSGVGTHAVTRMVPTTEEEDE